MKGKDKSQKRCRWLWVAGLLLLFLWLRQLPLYKPTGAIPFEGPYWYNPYQEVHPGGQWLRANFHAHSNAWGFVTSGRKNTVEDIVCKYDSLGYDIIGISDYHRITNPFAAGDAAGTPRGRLFVPVYEHGYNVMKTHQGAIGARKVYWNDYILPQTWSQKQHIIRKLKEKSRLVVLHHPAWMGGYSKKDMRSLTGYDLFEVLNDFWISEELWDVALSAGRPALLIAGDDAHNVFKQTDLARDLTMIFAGMTDSLLEDPEDLLEGPEGLLKSPEGLLEGPEGLLKSPEGLLKSPEGVYRALESGAAYGIEVTERLAHSSVAQKREGLDALPLLQSCKICSDSLVVVLSGEALQFNFIGQDGRLLKSVLCEAGGSTTVGNSGNSGSGSSSGSEAG
ncbi:MAG: hypothetical protein GX877_05680, partial [Bacteroidales bacterium]|nr:hypothetical protein [Bacteroidales bacterium]